MSISPLEQKKKNRVLLPVLIGIILITLIIIWQGFFKKSSIAEPQRGENEAALHRPKINIDWATLKNPTLETLEPFNEILPIDGAAGRRNPFLPY